MSNSKNQSKTRTVLRSMLFKGALLVLVCAMSAPGCGPKDSPGGKNGDGGTGDGDGSIIGDGSGLEAGTVIDSGINRCGNNNPNCRAIDIGDTTFPMPDDPDPNAEADGVGLDPNGDIILDETNVNFNYMWIANTNDLGIGTVSKIDTESVTETARYFSVTCFGNPSYEQGACEAVPNSGVSLTVQQSNNAPSRTAVDFNFDVWVANRAFGGQASVTKIANTLDDCVDRNGDGVINTSRDIDADGHITIDCNGDGVPDSIDTVCTNGLTEPEFLGWDDECVLMTVNYAGTNELGRSVCLDGGDIYEGGSGNPWVGTNARGGNNRFFQFDGDTGEHQQTVDLPAGHEPYGCTVDSQGVLWTVSQGGGNQGRLVYFSTTDPDTFMGQILQPGLGGDQFYGIAMDSEDNIWAGGWGSQDVYRYRPDRSGGFATLGGGVWTRVQTSQTGATANTRGIAADTRGYIWVASNNGCIIRIPQSIGDGLQPPTSVTWYGPSANGSCTLGGSTIGAGVDFSGNVWGISYSASTATRLDVDQNGTPTGDSQNLTVGANPYTYSDFTGFGLRNFTRPRGHYRYKIPGCGPDKDTHWLFVEWSSTEPTGTRIEMRFRTGEDASTLGSWYGSWDTSPADLSEPPPNGTEALAPNPADYAQVEFELVSENKENTPILHDFAVIWECEGGPVE